MNYLPRILTEKVVRDARYDPLVSDFDEVKKQAIIYYILGIRVVCEVTNGEFNVAVVIVDKCNVVKVIKWKELPEYPVANGMFMNWWEKDHEKYFEISESDWDVLRYSERAAIESALQLELWVKSQFANNFASIYYSKQYNQWWWNTNARKWSFNKQDKYWWKFLKNLDEFPELVKVIK